MTDIIFHIGLPKCASTTLQNKVFVNQRGYLGTSKGLRYEDNYGKKFEFLTPTGPRLFGDINGVQKMVDHIRDKFNQDFEENSPYILSSELLSNRNKLKERPIIDFLKEFQDKIWLFGRVKVLLVLRSPTTRIISEYCQVSNANIDAGQKDFEKYVDKIIKDERGIKYDKWVEELYSNFGVENTCVLFMEEIASSEFWEELKSFCNLKNFEVDDWLQTSSSNTRRKDSRTWKLRDYDPINRAHGLVGSVFGLVWPMRLLPRTRSAVRIWFEKLIVAYFKLELKLFSKNASRTEVVLTAELERRIRERFVFQINRLEELLGKDLKSLGF